MIESFRNKELAKLWKGSRTRINRRFHARIEARLDALDAAIKAEDLNLPGFDFYQLAGHKPTRFTVHVNGPWCITFEFGNGNAYNVDFEQYH